MIAQYGKRALALFLAIIMLISASPIQAFAAENEGHDHPEETVAAPSEPTEATSEPTDAASEESDVQNALSDRALSLTNRINAVVNSYAINGDMTEDEIFEAMYEKSDDELFATMDELDAISEACESATKADQEYIIANADVKACGKLLEAMNQLREIALFAASGTHKPVTGVTVGVSGATDNSMSNGQITVTAKGSKGILGYGASSKTATITVYNESGSKAKLSFDWATTSVNELKIDGNKYSGSTSGSFEKVLDAGENISITITTAKDSTTNKLVMSNFAIAAAKESSAITFQYDSELGSVTVAGEDVESGSVLDIPGSGAELKATAKNGGTFLGWIDASTRMIISKAATYTLEPADDMSVKAVFTKNACFLVNGNLLYEDLNEALTAANSGSNKTIVLANSGILPAGDYTIPSGVTLLVPFDDANTVKTTTPATSDTTDYTAPTPYRTLTMAEGANIIVNGAVSLPATQKSNGGNSTPIGKTAFIQMDSGSNITVNKGGNLYAWGFIQGSGSVIVESGATVYECFQVMDWRGGDNTSNMIDNSNRVFPMSQYYIQNIEVPMTIKAGATEKGYMSIDITLFGIQGSSVPFIGSDGMFNITSGYLVKDYDESTGRLLIDMYGDVSVKSLSITMKLSALGNKTMNSSKYTLPINGNMTINMHSGNVTMTQDIALTPGAKLIIGKDATVSLGSGNKIFVYDRSSWGEAGSSFCATDGSTHKNLNYPASAKNVQGRDEDAYVEINGVADLSKGEVYTTTGNTYVHGTGTIIMKPGTQKQTHMANVIEKNIKYVAIDVTAPKLENVDGTLVETANDKGVVTYTSVDGVWTCEHSYKKDTFVEAIITAATCLKDGSKTLTCNCGEDFKTEVIPMLAHEYVAVVTAPTCTEAGYTTHTCKNGCDDSYTDTPVNALGHTAGAEANCENAQICTVCGVELVAALGHTAGAEADCENAQVCTVCGKELKAALGHTAGAEADCVNAQTCTVCGVELVAALGHNWKWVTVKEATVLETGIKHEECSVCHATQNETEIPVLTCTHEGTVEGTEAQAETCTEAGNSAYWYCSACQNYYSDAAGQHEIEKDSWVIPAKEHKYSATVTYPVGVTKGYTVYTCDYECGDSYRTAWLNEDAYAGKTIACVGDSITAVAGNSDVVKDQTDYVKVLADKLGMEFIRLGASGTTLATDGSRTCNINQLTEAKLNGADVVTIMMGINDFVAAKDGEYELGDINSTDTSTIYGAVKMWCERIEELRATESLSDTQFYFVTPVITSWKNSSVRDWDQSKTNNNGYTLRDLCNAIIEVAALYDVAVIDLNLVSGLYYVDANDNNIDVFGGDGVHPSAAGHAMMANALANALLQNNLRDDHEHAFGSWIHTSWRSCTTGEQEQRVCSVCGKTEAGAMSEALGHDEVAHEAQAPTCKAAGWDAYVTCSRCDYTTFVELPKDANAHVWDEGEEYGLHSCNSPLRMKYKCTVKGCAKTKLEIIIEQHFRVPIAEEIPATCTTDGMTSGWKCEKCDEFWIPQEVIPALGHDWNGTYPCESDSSACARCDVKFDSKQEHLIVVDAEVAATCTTTGLTEGSHCEYCGVILVAQTETPKSEHNWFTDEIEVPATCTTQGHKAGATYCLDCDYDEDPVPALSHSWMHRDAKKATYSAIGWNAHDYCLMCKTTKTLEEYEAHSCEFCGENPEGYIEIPMVAIQSNKTYEEIITNLYYLEMMADQYAKENPGADPLGLVLNYMRTGVSNYTSGSWAIMAGSENKDFLKFVQEAEDAINSDPENDGVWVNVSGLKKLYSVSNPHGEENIYTNSKAPVLSGHFFGTMDMTYYNKGSQNHADVGGWVGDLTDLLGLSDEHGVPANLTLDEKVEYIRKNYLFKNDVSGSAGSFGSSDIYADLDAYYFANELITNGYEPGDLTALMREFYQPGLTMAKRVSYLLNNRLDGLSTRKDLRTAVYNAYTSNKLIATLEGTRNFNATGNELAELRKAVCYAFADEMCRLAGDYVEDLTNPRFTVFDTETKILAPGVSQQINYATNADGKQIVYYIATADVMREDVGVWVNYYDRDPGIPENPQWKNNSVPSSAQNAQDRYGDPASSDYIENFNVIASTNAGGYDMSDVATPGGLVVMNGIEWFPQTTTAGFFAIMDDGTAYMGSYEEYAVLKDRIKEAIGGFGEFVVKDGQVVGNATYSDAPRTSVGITATGRVVLMCIDGRQAPFSSGASLQDVGYIMKEAGCVVAINLDGGGSTTFVARQPGSEELTVMNRPSDGFPRNVSTNLLIYSTAPSSTKFDHAVIESEYDYATINTPVQMTAAGVSPAGNAVDIPEGATWAVSDESWASITADGVFTGKRLGEVTVYLMLDGQTIGSKLMTLTNPDQLYFEKTKVDAIYGSGVVLPLRARYEGKPIAINPSDVTVTLSAPNAGSMDGFTFNAVESTVKTMSITAALDENTKATINVMLYKQGENSFDFDKATGGDRMLAWYREVTNAKVEDGNIYNVIDPSKEMVTSYTFALDMTALPIPERLDELTYMLPGGTMEGTNAWTFLTSLAQRISDLSWVKATIKIDERFDVDYSALKVLNDYFELKSVEFDASTNTLVVTLGWIKQSQVIDAATANPLCMINGVKLTPKVGVWEDTTKINVVTSGDIGYQLYMRASGLYSFAQKPESQAVFGIYPYRNPADTSDAGGYFFDTYAEITDEFTLVNVLKEGWVNEDGGFAYYVDGERLTGVQKVEDFYYDFGENGVNVGQNKMTGLFYDEADKVYRYSYLGELTDGWQSINNKWHYFKNHAAVTGSLSVGGVTYDFNEDGSVVSGKWVSTFTGRRYYYGPKYYTGWAEIDSKWYYFHTSGDAAIGIKSVRTLENSAIFRWHEFGEDNALIGLVNGLHELDGKLKYYQDGVAGALGLVEYNGDYYCFDGNGALVVNRSYYAWKTACDMPVGTYYFGEDGRMVGAGSGEIVKINDVLYYYENGKAAGKGLVCVDGDYYCADGNGKLIVNQKYSAWKTSCDMPAGNYVFDAEGKLVGAGSGSIVTIDGKLYYYEYGVPANKGLMQIGSDYYYAKGNGQLAVNERYSGSKTSCDMPVGNYYYDAEGKLIGAGNGEIVTLNGKLYYFERGVAAGKGLVCVDDEYYFANGVGELIVNQRYNAWKTSCDMPTGNYYFDADGKLIGSADGEIVSMNGKLYYYERGNVAGKGLVCVDGDYYFANGVGELIVNQKYSAWKTSCDMPTGNYYFGADGKLIGAKNGEVVSMNGKLYYYERGVVAGKGLVCVDGDYYFANGVGELIVNQKYSAWKTNCDMPTGNYYFGADGKLIGAKNGEIVSMNGKLYYYERGIPAGKGLVCVDGEYYFANGVGELIVNCKYSAWKTNCDMPTGNYYFGADGKMIGAKNGEIVSMNGKLYYYEHGIPVGKGLVCVDGEYYFANGVGELVVNQKYSAWKTNCDLPTGNYYFGADGKMIGAGNGEIVSINGKLYYYEYGVPVGKGLVYVDGYYYFANGVGELITNQKYYVWKTNDLLADKTYTFNELGQIIG